MNELPVPLRIRFWYALHDRINRLAWRFAPPPISAAFPHERSGHPLWRLNDWAARHWVDWWTDERLGGRPER